ncbi:MAG: amidohydrolase family protein [Clostridia bacterium]|nr:amidohydrolase family protein [Clostridia bacterium]
MDILIKNGKVWSGEKFFYSDIFISNKKIEKIEQEIVSDADFTYDATGKIVSPGLVDIHTHLSGISTKFFGTHPELSCVPFGVCNAIDASAIKGNSEFADSFLLKTKVFAPFGIKNNHIETDVAEKMISAYGDKMIGVKVCFDVTQCDAKDATPLMEAREFAKKHNLKVMVHTTGSPTSMTEVADCLEKGDIISHPFHGGENNSSENGFEALKKAKEKGIIIDSSFAGHVHTDFGILKDAVSLGILPDTVSTDITCRSAYIRGGRYGMTMCMSILKTLGMSEEDIFRASTKVPGQIFDSTGNTGVIEVGANADISVFEYGCQPYSLTDNWSGNTVSDENGYICDMTVINGEIVYRR